MRHLPQNSNSDSLWLELAKTAVIVALWGSIFFIVLMLSPARW